MNNINELLNKLPAPLSVAIDCHTKNPVLYPLRETVSLLQLAFYWWRKAVHDLDMYSNGTEVETVTDIVPPSKIIVPTLIGTSDQLQYINKELTQLGEATLSLKDSIALPPTSHYCLEQGYNKVMDALFNVDISTKYYEQLTGTAQEEPK